MSLGAYRVFGCQGSTTDDVMLKAMELAQADGMQILNMSIGDAFNAWPESPTAAAASKLVDGGMVVVASIGNSGANGLYSNDAPGVGDKVIGVASYDNKAFSTLTFDLPGKAGVPYLTIANVPDPPKSGTVSSEVVAVGRGCPASGATPADPYLTDPSGKIALVTRGSCTFDSKYQRAVAAGAVGVVIRNSSPGLFVGGGVTPVAGRFLVAVSQADGVAIAALSQPNRASLTWTSTRVNAPNPTGGLMSSFSSYGPTAVLGLKPDLGAPGGFIRSTYPLELGGYTVLSGTSMSSPHVAGAAALLEQAHPSLPAASFRDVLMNSASPAPWSLGPQYGIADYVFRQGAGMINIPASIGAQTTITPSKVALGEGSGGPFTLHLQNGSSHPVTYDVAYEEGLGAGPPGMPFGWTFLLADTKASLPATVTVPGSGSAAVTGSLAADPTLDPTSLYGGWVTFTSQEDGQVLRVPIMGLAGDYQAIVAMPTVDLGGGFRFPSIGKEVSPGSFDLLPATQGGTWGLTGPSDIPNVLVHFDHQVQLLRMQVVNAGSGRPVHPVFSYFVHSTLLPRNSTGTGFFAYPWDGTRMQDNGKGTPDHRKVVPDGQYKIVVTALKALGNPANASDWETYTSPTITIDRP